MRFAFADNNASNHLMFSELDEQHILCDSSVPGLAQSYKSGPVFDYDIYQNKKSPIGLTVPNFKSPDSGHLVTLSL